MVEAAGVEPASLPIFLNDFNRIILEWTTSEQQFMINHLKMSVNRGKILKKIIPPINRYPSIMIPSQMITWKLSPAGADTFFKPMSIPFKWSRQVAGRIGRLVSPSPNGSPGWKSVYSDSLEERIKIFDFIIKEIRKYSDCLISLCKESEGVWWYGGCNLSWSR